MNAAATDSEHEEVRLVVEAAAALDLNEDASTTGAAPCTLSEDTNAAAGIEKTKTRDVMSKSQEKKPVRETIRSEDSLRRGEKPRKEKNTD